MCIGRVTRAEAGSIPAGAEAGFLENTVELGLRLKHGVVYSKGGRRRDIRAG